MKPLRAYRHGGVSTYEFDVVVGAVRHVHKPALVVWPGRKRGDGCPPAVHRWAYGAHHDHTDLGLPACTTRPPWGWLDIGDDVSTVGLQVAVDLRQGGGHQPGDGEAASVSPGNEPCRVVVQVVSKP